MISIGRKIKGYRETFRKYGIDHRALQWNSKQAQELRFKQLVNEIDFEGKNILDVGCGFGDIIPFISAKTKNFEYIGVDIIPEFLQVAKNKYPKRKFIERDYFENPIDEMFDIVLTSGTLNANIKNPYKYRARAIQVMWEHSNDVVAFNMAGAYPQLQNKKGNRVYYADLDKIIYFCKTLTTNIIIRKEYRPNDFTIIMFK